MSDAALLRAFVGSLVAAGVRDVVACPGSRSTPLALALSAHAEVRLRVLLDERAAGFFALGLARTSRRPVAVLVTSGTAAMELGPAVVEAAYSRVPLVVLTADRPAELRDRGAPQTIDQDHLYGRMAKWFAEVPLFDGDPATTAHVRWIAGRAVATATAGPAGPVHLNAPFREPLLPDGPLTASADMVESAPFATVESGRRRLDDAGIDAARRPDRRHRARARSSRARTTTRDSPTRSRRSRPPPASRSSPTRCRACAPATHDRRLVIGRADQLTRQGAVDRGPPARCRHSHRRDAHVQADRRAARADAAGPASSSTAMRAGASRRSCRRTFVHADPAATADADRRAARRPDR